jgi:hypothetical protein
LGTARHGLIDGKWGESLSLILLPWSLEKEECNFDLVNYPAAELRGIKNL